MSACHSWNGSGQPLDHNFLNLMRIACFPQYYRILFSGCGFVNRLGCVTLKHPRVRTAECVTFSWAMTSRIRLQRWRSRGSPASHVLLCLLSSASLSQRWLPMLSICEQPNVLLIRRPLSGTHMLHSSTEATRDQFVLPVSKAVMGPPWLHRAISLRLPCELGAKVGTLFIGSFPALRTDHEPHISVLNHHSLSTLY
jgi:hypothetical protein